MNEMPIVLITAALFGWALVSARLQRADLTPPIVFLVLGGALAGFGLVDGSTIPETYALLVEVTLAWVLFSDAAGLRVQELRRDAGRIVRLLGVGLPLTVVFGWVTATVFFPDLGPWPALVVAAALAPTDAALGLPVVTNPAVPSPIRRLLTVESGLNDGIVTPVVLVAIAGAAAAAGMENAEGPGSAVITLLIGVAVGLVIGGAGGWLLRWARRRGVAADYFAGIGVLALALLTYSAAVEVGGNGFVAAFCGGLAFGTSAGPGAKGELAFLEQASDLVSTLVWSIFGAVTVAIVLERITVLIVVYAVLSLTVVRLVPVALSLIGSGLDRSTVLFVGWFGPRGLASIVFALLALEALGPRADDAVAIIAVTILLSVLAHGLSASPLAARYGRVSAASTAPVSRR